MTALPVPAQYLLRIDDLCPTVHARRWERLRLLIGEFGLHPILAVVPNNQDRNLDAALPDPGFWEQMRAMQAAGATIALHGYTHVCSSHGKSLVRLHGSSEFAGLAAEKQQQCIARGLEILRGHGLDPMIWVGPRHGFDCATLATLHAQGIGYLSDGLTRVPFMRGGVTWIPQQLWAPLYKPYGLWTISIHPNTTGPTPLAQLRAFLKRFAGQFTSFERVAAEFDASGLDASERLYEIMSVGRLLVRRVMKRQRNQIQGIHS